ncbi:hypothetical protein C8R46DRAFT_1092633 [Mycena filopes]|nr:hypothetical protein C8R46DRAFT_1092633 [Mycena filopes]
MFRIPASRRAALDDDEDDDDDGDMGDDGADVGGGGAGLDAGWHTDDVHGQRASTFLEPMAFAAPRPPSVAEPGLADVDDDGDGDDSGGEEEEEWEGERDRERSGITPTPTPPHRERLRPEAMYVPPDTVFVRPDPDSASAYDARPDSTYIRPDSSYIRPESSYVVADLHSAYTGASHSHSSPTNHDSFENGNGNNGFELRPDTPFLDTLVAVNSRGVLLARATAHAHTHGHGHTHGHARSQSVVRAEPGEGWMGEWNQGDMQDVIHKLRVLKA